MGLNGNDNREIIDNRLYSWINLEKQSESNSRKTYETVK